MELQQVEPSAPHPSFIEWAVGRRERKDGPHPALVPLVKSTPGGTLGALINAGGSSESAAELAQTAALVLEEYTHQSLIELFARVEKRCASREGLEMSAVIVSPGHSNMFWYGVGNLQGVLFHRNESAEPRIQYLERNGESLGTGQCRLRELCVPVKPGDLIILASEGVSPDFVKALPIDGKPRIVADQLLAEYCQPESDCAMVVIRYLGHG